MDFKGRAKNWDSDSMIKRSKVVSEKLLKLFGERKNASVMEYGSATGLISFNLKDSFKKLTLMDSEKEMIDVIKEKIEFYNTNNIIPVNIDLTKDSYNEQKFDIIFSSMALHHIKDTNYIVNKFYELLNNNGLLCVVELDKEDGSFHMNETGFDGHNGFEHKDMEFVFKKNGFKNVKSETFYYDNKKYKEYIIPYSMFYTIGTK